MAKLQTRKTLEARYRRACDAYYNTAKPIMSDAEFDRLQDTIRQQWPDSPVLKQVGAPPRDKRKVALPFAMPSLDKVKPDGSAEKWLKAIPARAIVYLSLKADGVAAQLVTDAKGRRKLYTRGTAEVGQDISHLLPHLQGIGKLPPNHAVRGELIITRRVFEHRWSKKFENSRNLVSGVVNANGVHEAASSVVFRVHTMVAPEAMSKAAALLHHSWLISNGFQVVPSWGVRRAAVNETYLVHMLNQHRRRADMEIDGLVMRAQHTGETLAFKGQDEEATAVVSHVEWAASRHGKLKPVIVLSKPIRLDGASITRVTGHNASNIAENKIGKGATIRIVRSGQVIPKLQSVVKPAAKADMPPSGTYKMQGADAVSLTTDRDTGVARLVHCARSLDMKGFKDGLLGKLYDTGVDKPEALLTLTAAQTKEAGLGPIQRDAIVSAVRETRESASHVDMMLASGCFPPGWGRKRLVELINTLSFDDLCSLNEEGGDALEVAVGNVPRVGPTLAQSFAKGFVDYAAFIERIDWQPRVDNSPKPLAGKSVVFTGIRNPVLERRILALGGSIGSSVCKTTSFVVCKSANHSSVKVSRAKRLGVNVRTMSEAERLVSSMENQK